MKSTLAAGGVAVEGVTAKDQLLWMVKSLRDASETRWAAEEMAAELADESNRSLKAMAVMSALLLPGTLVVGVFGMNTAGLPFTHGDSGFIWAVALVIGATGLFYWLLRRAGISLRF